MSPPSILFFSDNLHTCTWNCFALYLYRSLSYMLTLIYLCRLGRGAPNSFLPSQATFYATFLRIAAEVRASGLQHVLELCCLGVSKGTPSVVYFSSNKSLFESV